MNTNDNTEELIKSLDDDYFQCIEYKKHFLKKDKSKITQLNSSTTASYRFYNPNVCRICFEDLKGLHGVNLKMFHPEL